MKFIEWDDKFSVGILIINEQHKELIKFTNDLYDGCTSDDATADQTFRKAMKDAVAYVKEHFSMEENLMSQYKYPDIQQHKQEHSRFIIKIVQEAQFYEKRGRAAAIDFIRFLKDWLLGHIAYVDKKLGAYLISKGVL